ncbi:MAG: iron ABC transporter permease [Anaerocolumna sp.]
MKKLQIILQKIPYIKTISFLFFTWFIFGFLIIPNLNVLYQTFWEDGHFSVEVFLKLFHSQKAMNSLKNSFILAVSMSITVNLVGITLVLLTEYFDIRGAKFLRLGYMTTLVYSGVVLVSGYKFIYGNGGIITDLLIKIFPQMNPGWFEGYGAVIFVMTFACTSNHMIFLRNALQKVDFQTIEAAKSMGASAARILFKVVLPTLLPTIFAVTILTFLTGLSATSAPMMVGGDKFQTITPMILLFSQSMGSKDLAALMSIILGIATIILLTIMTRIEKKGNYMSVSKVKTALIKQKIHNRAANAGAYTLAYILFLVYVVPVVLIIFFSFTDVKTIMTKQITFDSFSLDNYKKLVTGMAGLKPFLVSFVYALIASAAVSALAIVACRLIRRNQNRLTLALEYSLLIPWMLPGTLIALGLVLTFNGPKWYAGNLILTGTPLIMVLAYIIVKIPFTLRMTKASFFSIDDSLEDAARSLGLRAVSAFIKISLPVIMPSVLAVLALNFTGLLTDYDLSVFLFHPLYQPLGVYIKSLTDSTSNADNTAMSLVYAVLIMVISTVVLSLVYGRRDEDKNKRKNKRRSRKR